MVELIDLDKLEAGEEREIKACSSVSGLNGRVNGSICCLEKMQIIGGEILEFSIFDLSISRFLLAICALVPCQVKCFVKNYEESEMVTHLHRHILYVYDRCRDPGHLDQGREFLIDMHNQFNSQSNTQHLPPHADPWAEES